MNEEMRSISECAWLSPFPIRALGSALFSMRLARHSLYPYLPSLLQVGELCKLRKPHKFYGSNGTMSLLGNDYLGHSLFLRILVIVIISVDKHYNVGILLNGSGLTKI